MRVRPAIVHDLRLDDVEVVLVLLRALDRDHGLSLGTPVPAASAIKATLWKYRTMLTCKLPPPISAPCARKQKRNFGAERAKEIEKVYE